MKKAIIILALLATAGGGLQAQDTLWQKPAPLSNYFYNNWIDTTGNYETHIGRQRPRSYVIARQFTTDDTLQVYGIAAMMVNSSYLYLPYYTTAEILAEFAWRFPDDPTLDNCEESLMLFQYHGNVSPPMQQVGDTLPVHTLYTPVNHYIMSNNPVSTDDGLPKPVYERYFMTPQTVSDTFFVGFTQNDGGFSKITHEWHALRPYLCCLHFGQCGIPIDYTETEATLRQEEWDAPIAWEFSTTFSDQGSYFIFPILTPAPPVDTTVTPIDTTVTPIDTTVTPIDTTVTPIDTTVTPIDTVTPGGDTLGVQTADLVSRYVSVLPNPAHERAEVLSSFGLTKIELYDEQGRLLRTLPAAGLRATLDLHSLPPATYLLRIHTPAGTTTKKLLVR